jgi:hypothetical protein
VVSPHWRLQRLVGVLLGGRVLEEDVRLRPESKVDVVADLTGLSKVDVVVGREAEDGRPDEPEPTEEPSDDSFPFLGQAVPTFGVLGRPRSIGQRLRRNEKDAKRDDRDLHVDESWHDGLIVGVRVMKGCKQLIYFTSSSRCFIPETFGQVSHVSNQNNLLPSPPFHSVLKSCHFCCLRHSRFFS